MIIIIYNDSIHVHIKNTFFAFHFFKIGHNYVKRHRKVKMSMFYFFQCYCVNITYIIPIVLFILYVLSINKYILKKMFLFFSIIFYPRFYLITSYLNLLCRRECCDHFEFQTYMQRNTLL